MTTNTITTNKEGGANAMKTENLEMNTIQRKYHFESGRQAYTAWITIDTEDLDLKVVYRPKEFPELSNLPDFNMPIIIIQNDTAYGLTTIKILSKLKSMKLKPSLSMNK